MASYILRKVDPDIWQRVRVRTVEEKITIRDLIERLLAEWLAGSR